MITNISAILAPYVKMATAAYAKATIHQLAMVGFMCWIGVNIFFSSTYLVSVVCMAIILSMFFVIMFAPTMAACGILTIVLAYVFYMSLVFNEWEKQMAGHRLTRRDQGSPSNNILPSIKK